MKIVWHGTASIEVICSKGRLIFDPFVPLNGSPVGVNIEDFDGFSDIFVTHGHFDHISSIPQIKKRNPEAAVYCTDTPFQTLKKKGVPEGNLKVISYGQTLEAKGFKISVLHGKHGIMPILTEADFERMRKSETGENFDYIMKEDALCPENDETVFFVLEADGRNLSLMGSMNLRDDVEYPQGADLLIMPYNGWADNYPHAVETIERLEPKRVFLDHYDDAFPPKSRFIDPKPIQEKYGKRVFTKKINTEIEV